MKEIILNDFGFSESPVDQPKQDSTWQQTVTPVEQYDDTVMNNKLDTIIHGMDMILQNHEVEVSDKERAYTTQQLEKMSELILPLLTRLMTAQSDNIYWPKTKRDEVISEQIDKIESLLE